MKHKVKHIATIQTGLFAKPVSNADALYLQTKHFTENLNVNSLIQPSIIMNGVAEKHILRKGDVLFAAKGDRNFATYFDVLEYPSVASTSFFVIRLHDKNVLPEYFAWFLNQPRTINLLKRKAKGTSIASISKATINDVEISVPSIDKQKMVLKIHQLRNREKKLIKKKDLLRGKIIQQKIINSIK